MVLVVPQLASNKNLAPGYAALLYSFTDSNLSTIARGVSLVLCVGSRKFTILPCQYGDILPGGLQGLLPPGQTHLARFPGQWQGSEHQWRV